MKRLACIGVGLVLLSLVAVLVAQQSAPTADSISRVGTAPNQQYNTFVVDAGKAIAYAKQIMRGSPAGASGESVESALNRLEWKADNLSVDWGDITNKPIIQGVTSISANRVEWTSDADGIFGTGTQDVEDALTYLDNVTLSQWPGSLSWGRITSKPTHWQWSLLSGRPSVWPGTVPSSRTTFSSDAGGIFGTGTRNVGDALAYLDDYAPASRWPTWAEVQTQSGSGLSANTVTLNTSGFDGTLTSSTSTVQFLADAVDNLGLGWETVNFTSSIGATGSTIRSASFGHQHFLQMGKMVVFSLNPQFTMERSGTDRSFTLSLPSTVRSGFEIQPNILGDPLEYDSRGITGSSIYIRVKSDAFSSGRSHEIVRASVYGYISGFYIKQ